ncbi:hypothetical protein EG68_00537 [Paragonimus skrjabini miyazakii]|uniref:CUB domain-containing protein n=1 Tax=Paragonimus skrjabini miyazakii TaxID=59628 RepID=A0A8S9ZCA3_9TREM|nr:hypothetical protein EG68_00537 [Paragonimus skrjabini miyazakii]
MSEITSNSIKYPKSGNYMANVFCNWRIELAAGTRVRTAIGSVAISDDLLFVFDGPTCTSPMLLRLTGVVGQTVVASGNNTSFMFISDGNTEETGFRAMATAGTCGETLTGDVGTLDGSAVGTTGICIWHINTTSARKVNLMINEVTGTDANNWYRVFNGGSCANPAVMKNDGPNIAAYNYPESTSQLVVVSYGIPIQGTYTARASLKSMAWVKYSMILTAATAWWKI